MPPTATVLPTTPTALPAMGSTTTPLPTRSLEYVHEYSVGNRAILLLLLGNWGACRYINLEANLMVTDCLLRDIRRHPRIRCSLLFLSAGQGRTAKQHYEVVAEVGGAPGGIGRQERSHDSGSRAGCSRQAPFLLCRRTEERTLRDEVSRVRY